MRQRGIIILAATLSEDLQVLFVTIDPERDTPERPQKYIPYFNDSFIGLTGSPDEIKKAADAYSVFYEREKRGDSGSVYFMNHTQTLFLIDKNVGLWSYHR